MSARILESNNYGKFQLMEFSREVKKTKHLEASMREHGWIDAYPAHVIRNGEGKWLIKAGNHRFEVARKLGIGIKFVECHDNATIHGLEKATVPWGLSGYLTSFARMGKSAYLAVRAYQEKTGIPLTHCISLLGGESAGSHNLTNAFKDGTFRLGNSAHSEVMASIIGRCKECEFPYWKNSLFIQAVSKIVQAEGFDLDIMKNKIGTFCHYMKKQADMQEYVEMLDSIYNRQSQVKVPLAFLAEEAARKRDAIKTKR
jgi:hypothetical protein